MRTVTVFGGTGFLGRRVVQHARERGFTVRVASRHPERGRARSGADDPQLEFLAADIHDRRAVEIALAGAYGAVNAVSLYVERGRETFHSVHVEAAALVADAARATGVARLVHVSGIGADPSSRSLYIRKRGEGEAAVHTANPDALPVRPAVMFGPDDAFLTQIVELLRRLPFYPMFGRGRTRLQPAYVENVAEAIAAVLQGTHVGPPLPSTAPLVRPNSYRQAPLGWLASVASGLVTGGFWALGPLYATASGLSARDTALFMATVVLGGAVCEWPIGYLSDRFGRRLVMLGAACLGVLASIGAVASVRIDPYLLYACLVVFGGVIFALYPLSVSYAADRRHEGDDMIGISRGLLLTSGIGAALGPLICGQLVGSIGRDGLFVFCGAVMGALALFAVWRISRRPPVPLENQTNYASVHETTPLGLAIDPRLRPADYHPDAPR